MQAIMSDYKIIVSDDMKDCELKVNNLIKEGYLLQGGVATSVEGENCFYYQALFKP